MRNIAEYCLIYKIHEFKIFVKSYHLFVIIVKGEINYLKTLDDFTLLYKNVSLDFGTVPNFTYKTDSADREAAAD